MGETVWYQKTFEKILAENSPNLAKDIDLQTERAQRAPKKCMAGLTLIKLNTKDKFF